jgi:hypothetical protein
LLRPIAITGGASLEFPLQRSSTTYFSDPEDGSLELFSTKNDAILHWGFSIQYSTFYMSDRFTGTPRTEEPRQQYVPLIEFAVASPLGPSPAQKTAATANPGLAYVGQTWGYRAAGSGGWARARWTGSVCPVPRRSRSISLRQAAVQPVAREPRWVCRRL